MRSSKRPNVALCVTRHGLSSRGGASLKLGAPHPFLCTRTRVRRASPNRGSSMGAMNATHPTSQVHTRPHHTYRGTSPAPLGTHTRAKNTLAAHTHVQRTHHSALITQHLPFARTTATPIGPGRIYPHALTSSCPSSSSSHLSCPSSSLRTPLGNGDAARTQGMQG